MTPAVSHLWDHLQQTPTSSLIAMLNPEVAAGQFDGWPIIEAKAQLKAFMFAVAAEIDRRIPIPAPAAPTSADG